MKGEHMPMVSLKHLDHGGCGEKYGYTWSRVRSSYSTVQFSRQPNFCGVCHDKSSSSNEQRVV